MTSAELLLEEAPRTSPNTSVCMRVTELCLILQSLDNRSYCRILATLLDSLAMQTPNGTWWDLHGPILETKVVDAIRRVTPPGFLFQKTNGVYHFAKKEGSDIVDLSSFA